MNSKLIIKTKNLGLDDYLLSLIKNTVKSYNPDRKRCSYYSFNSSMLYNINQYIHNYFSQDKRYHTRLNPYILVFIINDNFNLFCFEALDNNVINQENLCILFNDYIIGHIFNLDFTDMQNFIYFISIIFNNVISIDLLLKCIFRYSTKYIYVLLKLNMVIEQLFYFDIINTNILTQILNNEYCIINKLYFEQFYNFNLDFYNFIENFRDNEPHGKKYRETVNIIFYTLEYIYTFRTLRFDWIRLVIRFSIYHKT